MHSCTLYIFILNLLGFNGVCFKLCQTCSLKKYYSQTVLRNRHNNNKEKLIVLGIPTS